MRGSVIDIQSRESGTFRAYVAAPPQGSGPGLVLLHEILGVNDFVRDTADRFAEEGYLCVVPDLFWRIEPGVELGYTAGDLAHGADLRRQLEWERAVADVEDTCVALGRHAAHAGGFACVGYSMGGYLACLCAARLDLPCACAYYPSGVETCLVDLARARCPVIVHAGDADPKLPETARDALAATAAVSPRVSLHVYPGCGHGFANPARDAWDKPAAMLAWSRTIALLRRTIGPVFDLSMLWDKHTEYEFVSRDVDATMRTMVDEPYVNHIPTMTGGVGHDHLKRFYKYHFVDSNPEDTRLIPVSRTVGADRLVDEMVFCFTHTREIPWMLPGIPPTGRYVEVPLVAIVNFRGDRLCHEHIYWDQASVLVQIGILDAAGLPVAGVETAYKLLDETLPSNTLMAEWSTSEGKPL